MKTQRIRYLEVGRILDFYFYKHLPFMTCLRRPHLQPNVRGSQTLPPVPLRALQREHLGIAQLHHSRDREKFTSLVGSWCAHGATWLLHLTRRVAPTLSAQSALLPLLITQTSPGITSSCCRPQLESPEYPILHTFRHRTQCPPTPFRSGCVLFAPC